MHWSTWYSARIFSTSSIVRVGTFGTHILKSRYSNVKFPRLFSTREICTKWTVVVPIHSHHFLHHSFLKLYFFQKTITHCKYYHQTDAMWRFRSHQRSNNCLFAKEVTCVEMKIVCCQYCTVSLYSTVKYCTLLLPYHSYVTSAVVRHNFVLSYSHTVLDYYYIHIT